jgi:hypothetical protein
VGKVSKAKKEKKRNRVWGGEKIKFQKKTEIRGKKKLGRGRGEIKLQKKN